MIERRSRYRPLKTFLFLLLACGMVVYASLQLYPG